MDIFVMDFLKDFCYAKYIFKTLLLRNYVQVQPHPTGATKIKLLQYRTRLEEVNSDSGELLPILRSVTDWKNMLTTFFFFPVASWLINDGRMGSWRRVFSLPNACHRSKCFIFLHELF